MPIIRKKTTTKGKDPKVYMPYKKVTPRKKPPKKIFSFFKKKSVEKRGNRRRGAFKIPSFLKYLLFGILGVGLIYVSVLFIIDLRDIDPLSDYEEEYVVGIEEIPAYPLAEFIFLNSIEEPSVANFVSSGNSAYRLPLNTNMSDVFEYYQEKLPALGWSHVLSVSIGSEEMEYGEYWTKDNNGLRIYSKFNDAWYETISVEDATSGLKKRVEQKIERELLLTDEDLQDLLPDFPWILQVPKEYLVSYRSSTYKGLRQVEFRRLGTEEKILLVPVSESNGSALDTYLEKYIEILNTESEKRWGITRTVLISTEYGTALSGTINSGGETHEVAVMINPNDRIAYVLDSNTLESPFFEIIVSTIKPQETFRY